MNTKIKTYITPILLCVFTLMSCKKDSFSNLTAEISSESNQLGTTEGKPVIANILLSEELSEDISLQYTFEIDNIDNFINESDYNPVLEYSNDLGRTWEKAVNQKVILKQRNRNLKVRLLTNDDQLIEFHEEFDLVFQAQVDNKFELTGTIDPIRITVDDNEENPIEEALQGALYDIDNNYNFTLIGLNRNNLFNKNHKAMIDNGLDAKLVEDITKITQTGEIPIVNFEAIYSNSGLGGFVFNQSDNNEDAWYMAMNLFYAYHGQNEEGLPIPIDYNSNGEFGFILTHEYGHILTLNTLNEINNAATDCQELETREGCFHATAALNQFSERFYESDVDFAEPHFVTDYASTNIAEDIAESFAFHVAQDDISNLQENSSGALHKIHFINENTRLQGFRKKIRNAVSHVAMGTLGEPIREFNFTKEGKRIPCTDHHAILKAAKSGKFLKN